MNKIVKFQSDLLKTNDNTAPQSCKILQMFVWCGAQNWPSTIQTFVNFCNFAALYLCSLKGALSSRVD